MKNPGPGSVIWAAMRLAAMPALNAVLGSLSLSSDCRTTTFRPLVGRFAAMSFAKAVGGLAPNVAASNRKKSTAGSKSMKSSLPTTCRPGVVSAVQVWRRRRPRAER
jgi:hypothetical protein